jgi:rhamnosyltransferase
MKSVAIIVSTYNGEKYIKEQLDSLLTQKGVLVEIFVRDDCSSDGTKSILNDYAERFKNIHVDFAENVGVGNSFMNALYSTPDTFDYYAFSDQDDIWEENKIIEAVKMLETSGALLYASNQECVDKDGNSLGLRWSNINNQVYITPEGIIGANYICGCTMVFTRELYLILNNNKPNSKILTIKNHDGWVAAVAALNKSIVLDERSFMKYRQHGNNVVGAYRKDFVKATKSRIKNIFRIKSRKLKSDFAREMCKIFPDECKKFPLIKVSAEAKSFKGKIVILKNQKQLRKYAEESRIKFFIKVLVGLY